MLRMEQPKKTLQSKNQLDDGNDATATSVLKKKQMCSANGAA